MNHSISLVFAGTVAFFIIALFESRPKKENKKDIHQLFPDLNIHVL
jgi:hypothetical protein